MTPEQLELIASTATVVMADDHFPGRFYERLFEADPHSRSLFPADMAAQRAKLVDELSFMVEAAEDLDAFVERTRALGDRHTAYGVTPAHYATVGAALMGALADVLGAAWTAEARSAWQQLYDLIAETMLEGASGSMFADF
jgi:hemoglobin-like flavoprotein